MDYNETFEDEDILIDLGTVSEETKGPGGPQIEQDVPLFREA